MNPPDLDEFGPVDYLVVEFPSDRTPDGSALPLLLDLIARDIIRVLDLTFVRKQLDGAVTGVAIEDLGLTGDVDITLFAEAASGLTDGADIDAAASVLRPGCSGAVLIYENHWAAPFATALRHNGAQLVATGRIPTQAIVASLDALPG